MDYFAAMRAFVGAAELGSFSKAAAREGMKVSTVSRHISALEADLGAALFNRSTRRIHITEVGRAFYERATRILADLEDARFSASALNATPQGDLRINIPAAFGRRHIMPHMPEFRAQYPNIRVGAELTEQPLDLIDSGIDVAIQTGPLVDSRLVVKRLAGQRRLVVASPAYIERVGGPPSHPSHLAQHDCLLHSRLGDVWYFRDREKSGGLPLEVSVTGALRANDPEVLLHAALDGLGVALLPNWLVDEDVAAGRLLNLLGGWQATPTASAEDAIWALYAPKKVVSPKVRAFLGFYARQLVRME